MNTRVLMIEVTRRRNGKLYPAHLFRGADRSRLVRLEHRLVHHDGMTYRAAQARLLNEWGLKRSLGALAYDLRTGSCPSCPGPPDGPGRVVITPR